MIGCEHADADDASFLGDGQRTEAAIGKAVRYVADELAHICLIDPLAGRDSQKTAIRGEVE
jgi:hypothetical protein